METDYAKLDHDKILKYIRANSPHCLVEDIIKNAGADKVRVYSLLIQMELGGEIETVESSFFGAPVAVKIK